jgi:hypothetical protein
VSRREDQDDRRADHAIDAAARAWADREGRAVTGHPDPEELVDYQEGRLDPPGVERVQRHLVACAACRDELLRLEAFDQEVPEGSPLLPPEETTERSWERFQAARDALRPAPEAASEPSPASFPGLDARRLGRRWLFAASILLALAAGALLGAILLRSHELAPIASFGSPFVFDLDPVGATLLRDAAVLEVAVPPGMDPLVARLNLGDLTAHEGYRVEVYDDRGRPVLHREGLVREPSGTITFLVPRGEWPAGQYRVALIALDAGRRQQLAEYAFRLRYGA